MPDDYPTIQEALFAAHDGDVIIVADGVWTGPYNKNIDFGGLAVTLRSENGPENCIIDCENDGRGFYFRFGEGPDSVVDGFTITNGSALGGGVACYANSNPTLTNCTISRNSSSGIYCDFSSPTITDCTIAGNTAYNGGGFCCEYSSPTIANCTIAGNTAPYDSGGGVWCYYGSPTLTNCTFSGNSASFRGGGIYSQSIVMSIVNCVLWNDTADEGPEIAVATGTLSTSYSDIEGGWAWAYIGSNGTLDWGEGNIVADPLFVDPDGPDDDPSTWEDNDYHLGTDSPCIDAGDPNFVPEPDERDIDGQMRVWDGDDDGEWIVDMGSDEFGSQAPGDLDGDGCVGHADLGILLSDWGCTGGDCPGDCDFDGDTDHADLGLLLGHWGEGCP